MQALLSSTALVEMLVGMWRRGWLVSLTHSVIVCGLRVDASCVSAAQSLYAAIKAVLDGLHKGVLSLRSLAVNAEPLPVCTSTARWIAC